MNKLAKETSESSIRDKALEIVSKWKKDLKKQLEQERAYQTHRSSQEAQTTLSNNPTNSQTSHQNTQNSNTTSVA